MKRYLRPISMLLNRLTCCEVFAACKGSDKPSDITTATQSPSPEMSVISLGNRKIMNFNSDWGYYMGDLNGAEAVDYNDEAFANVTIPHTMRLEKKHCNGANSTYQGIGWYRRYFSVDASNEGKQINIDF